MILSLIGTRWAGILGIVGLAGCGAATAASTPLRSPYPEFPSPSDPLATDPCAVQDQPDITLRNAPFRLMRPLHDNLQFLEEANPVFLCGLTRIELLGDAEYKASTDPRYTRRSNAIYSPLDRVIRMKASTGITLTHEVGHHVHNLGYFAPTVRAFLDLSWRFDPETGERMPRCSGPDCFLHDSAASSPREDWARTFERVLLRPIETSVAVNFPLHEPNGTPIQEKIALIRSVVNLPKPVKGEFRFGEARFLSASETLILNEPGDPKALPASLSPETVRRIFRKGKASIQPSVWENRANPFIADGFVVFPVFQEQRKTLGFFLYDLENNRFSAASFELIGVPKVFQRKDFSDLKILKEDDGKLLLIGQREDGRKLAIRVSFSFDPL